MLNSPKKENIKVFLFVVLIFFTVYIIFFYKNLQDSFSVSESGKSYVDRPENQLSKTATRGSNNAYKLEQLQNKNKLISSTKSQQNASKIALSTNAALTEIKQQQATFVQQFKENHARIVRTLAPPKSFVYVVESGNGGYGNKINSLCSGFLVAVVTRSAFIVNLADIDKYIEEPMEKCFSNFSAQHNELNSNYAENETFIYPENTFNSFNANKNLENLYLEAVPTGYTRFVFSSIVQLIHELACNRSYFETYLNYGIVAKETVQKAIEILDQKQLRTNKNSIDALYKIGKHRLK